MLYNILDMMNNLVDADVYNSGEIDFTMKNDGNNHIELILGDFTAEGVTIKEAVLGLQESIVDYLKSEGHCLQACIVEEIEVV